MSYTTLIFDLDGVLVDTAKYHYLAWKKLADELDIPFSEKENELFKGVSRVRCMEILLELGGRTMSEEEKAANCTKKNNTYVNAYTATRITIQLTIDKLMGKSEFQGVSPVDAFCGLPDAKL